MMGEFKVKHSPRPWRKHGGAVKARVAGKGWRAVCTVNRSSTAAIVGDEREANLSLLVAAPELLNAARCALALLRPHISPAMMEARRVLREAIDLAEGGD